MRSATRYAAFLILFCLGALQAGRAAGETVKEIAPFCERAAAGQDHAVQYGICAGTLGAVIAMADLMYRTQDMCIPEKTSVADAAVVVRSYAAQHPEAGDKDFTTVAVTSLSAAYSCH